MIKSILLKLGIKDQSFKGSILRSQLILISIISFILAMTIAFPTIIRSYIGRLTINTRLELEKMGPWLEKMAHYVSTMPEKERFAFLQDWQWQRLDNIKTYQSYGSWLSINSEFQVRVFRLNWIDNKKISWSGDPLGFTRLTDIPTNWQSVLSKQINTSLIIDEKKGSISLPKPHNEVDFATIFISTGQLKQYLVLSLAKTVGPGFINYTFVFLFLLVLWTIIIFVPLQLMAIVIGGFIARRNAGELAKPITRLVSIAKEIAAGNLKIRADITGPTEIKDLATNINTMSQSLARTIEQISAAKQQLEKILRHKQQLFSNISHDLRTPLANILVYSEALKNNPDRKNYIEVIERESLALKNLIDDIFDLSVINQNHILNINKLDVVEILKNMVKSFQKLAWKKGILIRLGENSDQAIYFYNDQDKLVRILSNLIDNAIQYTKSGGLIELNAFYKDDSMIISISDTGIGIDEKDLPNIFDEFYRADNSRTNPSGKRHAGLGLSIVKNLVEMMKGHIEVRSILGEGSVFSLIFPSNQLDQKEV